MADPEDPKVTSEPFAMDLLVEKPPGEQTFANTSLDRVSLVLSVELGRTSMTLANARALRQGEIVPLGKSVGEPLDILVNGTVVAKGEVVAAENGKYGIRITEVFPSQQNGQSAGV